MNLLVNIDVDDLEAGIRFYQDALGLQLSRRFDDGFVELLGASSAIYLLQKDPGSAVSDASSQRRDYARHWTPVHLDFIVDHLDAALERAVAAGARRESDILVEPYGKLALLSDPFGHGFCLLEFTGRGYDELVSPSTHSEGEASTPA